VCGLTTAEIAAAFLVGEPTMAQRLSRARKTLRDADAAVRIPDPDEFGDRLAEVLAVVYLVFNEGYLASAGRTPARRDLAAQAVALNRLLHKLMPREPEMLGLLALLLLHESRAATRFDGWGRLVKLQDQDRKRWDTALIGEATRLLDRAMAMRRPGPYQIQAAIAALHAAPDYEQTDWRQIRLLYDRLQDLAPINGIYREPEQTRAGGSLPAAAVLRVLSSCGAAARRTRMVSLPLSRGVACRIPPWLWTTDRTMDRPSPTPWLSAARLPPRRRNGWNSVSTCCGGTKGPLLVTASSTSPGSGPAAVDTVTQP
jgi:RNA polymerase sigma-70 factor (ECF subfamily)